MSWRETAQVDNIDATFIRLCAIGLAFARICGQFYNRLFLKVSIYVICNYVSLLIWWNANPRAVKVTRGTFLSLFFIGRRYLSFSQFDSWFSPTLLCYVFSSIHFPSIHFIVILISHRFLWLYSHFHLNGKLESLASKMRACYEPSDSSDSWQYSWLKLKAETQEFTEYFSSWTPQHRLFSRSIFTA